MRLPVRILVAAALVALLPAASRATGGHLCHLSMSNLLLAMLHKMGAQVDAIGDSTAPLAI